MQFTALTDLPAVLTEMGFTVEVAHEWEYGQGDYLWTDPDTLKQSWDGPPSGYMVHHTATTAATPPPAATSKANAWIGLKRGDRLYQYGDGAPTIYLASAGPSRTSSGYGYRPSAWDNTFNDDRAPWKAQGPDGDTALNRYVFNVETVAEGAGTPLSRPVWDCVVGLGVALHTMFGWQERTLGHVSWTTRKNDPNWSVGGPNDGTHAIIDIQDAVAKALQPPIGDPVYLPITTESVGRESDIEWLQRALNRGGASLAITGVYDTDTVLAVQGYQNGDGTIYGAKSHDGVLAAAYGS